MTDYLETLVAYAHKQLSPRVWDALGSRGVSDSQISLYRVGYLNKVLPTLEGAAPFMAWASQDNRLDDVLVLPLTNALGRVLGVQLRHVDQARKGYMTYIADPRGPVLFGLGQAIDSIWRTEKVFLVEGGFDLFPVQRVLPYTVATLTARMTNLFARFLKRFVKRVYVGYDLDSTGRDASARIVKTRGSDFEVRVVKYPHVCMSDGKVAKDPGDIWEAWGDTRFHEFLLTTQETF